MADRLRDLLDAQLPAGVGLDEASRTLNAHPGHLVRSFSREFGMPPHRYVTGRRVDLARRLLLDGHRPADVATAAGFYDQSHLTRHFQRMLGTSLSRYTGDRRTSGPAAAARDRVTAHHRERGVAAEQALDVGLGRFTATHASTPC